MEDANFTAPPLEELGTTISVNFTLSDSVYLFLGVYLTIFGCLSFIGNAIVIYMIGSSPVLLKKPQNVIVLNLAVSDLGCTLCGYPLVASSNFARRWLFGNYGCYFYGSSCFFFSLASYASLVAISLYRYVCVCRPDQRAQLNKKNTRWVLCGTWVYAAVFPLGPFLGWSHYEMEPFGTSCSIAWSSLDPVALSFDITAIIFCYILPLSIIITCYIKITNKTRSGHINNGARRLYEYKVTIVCFMMVCAYLINWTPYAVLSMVSSFYPLPCILTTLPTMLAKSQPAVIPFLYAFHSKHFRTAIRKIICCWDRRKVALDQQAAPEQRAEMYKYDMFLASQFLDKNGIYRGSPQRNNSIEEHSDFKPVSSICSSITNDPLARGIQLDSQCENQDAQSEMILMSVLNSARTCTLQEKDSPDTKQSEDYKESNKVRIDDILVTYLSLMRDKLEC